MWGGLADLKGRRVGGGVGPGLGQATGSTARGWVTGDGEVEAKLRLQAALLLDSSRMGSGRPNQCKAAVPTGRVKYVRFSMFRKAAAGPA